MVWNRVAAILVRILTSSYDFTFPFFLQVETIRAQQSPRKCRHATCLRTRDHAVGTWYAGTGTRNNNGVTDLCMAVARVTLITL